MGRKQKRESKEEARLARLAKRVQARRADTVEVIAKANAEATLVRYLPIEVKGFEVLKLVGPNLYRADNSQLNSDRPGMQYRCSKSLDDRDSKIMLHWDETVQASSDGDGWVKCELQADGTSPGGNAAKPPETEDAKDSVAA